MFGDLVGAYERQMLSAQQDAYNRAMQQSLMGMGGLGSLAQYQGRFIGDAEPTHRVRRARFIDELRDEVKEWLKDVL